MKRLFPRPSWPADGDSSKSLLSVFWITVSYVSIYMCGQSLHYVSPVSKEASRNWLRSRGYPFPILHDGELFLSPVLITAFLCTLSVHYSIYPALP